VVYGSGRGAALDEESPCRPTFPLGRITLEAEELLRAAAAGERPIPVTVLRCGAIYGPGRLSSALISQGRFRVIGSGRNWNSRIHVDDLVSVLIALGQAPWSSGLYCVADRQACAVTDYYQYLAELVGVPPPPRVPVWQARLRGQARGLLARARGRAPFVDANVVGLFTADLRLDAARLWGDLGIEPRYPSYQSGIPAALAEENPSAR
jgi:nucleoside-diphosphate-sugar epimerase